MQIVKRFREAGVALGLLLTAVSGAAQAAGPTYQVLNGTQLVAKTNGKTQVVLDLERALPREHSSRLEGFMSLELHQVADFDGDGIQDAFIHLFAGGNCCPPEYVFVSLKPGGKVQISKGFSHWGNPVLDTVGGRKAIRIREDDQATTYWYGLRQQQLVVLKSQPIPALKASAELTLDSVSPEDGSEASLKVDLNGDGAPETLTCGYWDRWNTLMCGVESSTGKTLLSGLGCDRLGILPEKTRGYRDLVCGLDHWVRWNGQKYVAPF